MKKGTLIPLIVLFILCGSLIAAASAQSDGQIVGPYCCGWDNRSTDWNDTCSVNQFDSSLGILETVTVDFVTCGWQNFSLDSEDEVSRTFSVLTTGSTETTMPNGAVVLLELPDQNNQQYLTSDSDVSPDFEGGDWMWFFVEACEEDTVIYTAPADLAYFIGTGDVTFETEAIANADITGGGNYATLILTQIGNNICVTYEYRTLCIEGYKIDNCTGEGLAGWTINLKNSTGAVIATTTTNDTGWYSFCGLAPGMYEVCEEMQADWTNVGDTCIEVILTDDNAVGVNFVNTPLLCINGTKTRDCDGAPVADVTINLLDSSGEIIASTMTNGCGEYSFCGLLPGDYTVEEVLPAGWVEVSSPGPITLISASSTGNDFVNQELLCISGYKYNDRTAEALEGWEITLKNSTGAVIATTMTNANGWYSFCDLEPGNYEVCEGMEECWMSVGDVCIQVGLICEDSTANNFYNVPLATLGDYVWEDLNTNGIQDMGEPGVAGVTVNLHDCDGVIATTTTDANGYYLFECLEPNDETSCCYYVEFMLPEGYAFTMQDQGMDDAVDSDADSTGMTACIILEPGETDLTWDAGVYVPGDEWSGRTQGFWKNNIDKWLSGWSNGRQVCDQFFEEDVSPAEVCAIFNDPGYCDVTGLDTCDGWAYIYEKFNDKSSAKSRAGLQMIALYLTSEWYENDMGAFFIYENGDMVPLSEVWDEILGYWNAEPAEYEKAASLADYLNNYNDYENDYETVCDDGGSFDGSTCDAGSKKPKNK
jgi:hypothetical protein